MQKIRITHPDGMTLRGPLKVKLTMPQFEARAGLLGGRWVRGGVFDIPARRALDLAEGEVVSVARVGKLPRGRFEPVGWEMPPEPETATPAEDPAGEAETD